MSAQLSPDYGSSLGSFMTSCQSRIDEQLESKLRNAAINPRLEEALIYACLNGGKRIRPILVYATALAVDCEIEVADLPACAVELIHSYSLVHDDLPAMDDDDLRRGKPSLHKAYDEATAILVGDALQSLAFNILGSESDKLPDSTQINMVRCLASAIGPLGMVGGQFEDFESTGSETNIDALEALHRQKTGALIRASVALGAMC
ncbi:MAG: polyprenyl synthetase family protein, partial [Pseudomonadota bacterium]